MACSLYALGEADAANKIKSYISSEDCYVRNAAVQQLHAICGDADISCFRKDLQAQYHKESVGFVKMRLRVFWKISRHSTVKLHQRAFSEKRMLFRLSALLLSRAI